MSRRAPNVLVLGAVLGQPPGGVRRHNEELLPRAARSLRERGGDLTLLEGSTPVTERLRQAIECIPSEVPAEPPLRRFLAEGRAVRGVIRGAARAGTPFDLVHTGHLPIPRVPLPLTLTLHDLRDVELSGGGALRRISAPRVLEHACRRAHLLLTVSETVRRSLEDRFQPREVRVVPNAADHLRELPRAPNAAGEGPLLHVGHLEPRKNLELLLRVLALDPSLPALVLAGSPKGDEEERLESLALRLGVRERVQFRGPVSDAVLETLYASAACVVLPSSLEGFGIPVLEAQRARVPLAISNAGALPETAGEDVPSFPPDDPGAARRAIREALLTPRTQLEARAARAERRTWDLSAGRMVDAWCSVFGDTDRC